MLEVEKWAKNKPPIVALPAIMLVSLADYLYEELPQSKERRLGHRNFLLPEDIQDWYRLYRIPLIPLRAIFKLVALTGETGELILALFVGTRHMRKVLKRDPDYFRKNPPAREDIIEGVELLKKINAVIFAEIKDDVDPQPMDPNLKATVNQFFKENEQGLGFFILLFVPSLLLFQKSPHLLYRQAIGGDIDSIEKLLKLDPLLLHEPAIGHHIQKLRFSNRTNDYERLTAAVHKLAVTDFKEIEDARKRAKVEIAAMIKALGIYSNKPVKSTMIAKLFTAYAKDRDKSKGTENEILEDTDLPVGKSLTTAISRHITPWLALIEKVDS